MSRPRVLVVAHEPVGHAMAGPAIRAAELARVLAAAGLDVTLAAPPGSEPPDGVPLAVAGPRDQDALAAAIAAHDVVVAQQLPTRLLTQVARLGARLVADLYAPSPLEVLEYVGDRPPAEARRIHGLVVRRAVAHAAAADLILCASERQRDLWLGGLTLRGLVEPAEYAADPSLAGRVAVVPFGLPARPPRDTGPRVKGVWPGIAPGDRVLLWGGGIWNWTDPATAILATERLAALDPPVHLVVLGMHRPYVAAPDRMVAPERAVALAESRGLLGTRVHVNPDWTPYPDREAVLLDADLGVSTHRDHLEARFSFRTRVLDYLWASVPVVCTRGDVVAELVEREGLGAAVAPEDPAAFADACRALLTDPARHADARRRIAAVRPALEWEHVAAPLVAWCETSLERPPRRARGRALAAATAAQLTAMARETLAQEGAGALAVRVARNAVRTVRAGPSVRDTD
jgi:glycosyltransferase involved in cell wall biosynthesis